MKIVDLQVIPFWVPRKLYDYGEILPETKAVQTVTKIITDEGTEGYYFGGFGTVTGKGFPPDQRAVLEERIKLELDMGQFGSLQVLGATSEDVCEYYKRGLPAPGLDYETPPPYWEEICDPLDSDGYVRVPQEPGMGYKINWDYINDNLVNAIT